MIIVNLNKTLPEWAKTFAAAAPKDLNTVKVADLAGLAEICAGDWWRVTDMMIAQYGDLLLGCFNSQIIAAYHIAGHRQDPATGRVRFTLKPAYDYATIIGAAQPGGPWQQGEARGSRNIELADYADRYKSKPNTRAWKYNVAEHAVLQAGQLTRDATPPQQVTHPATISFKWPHLGEVTLTWTTTGLLEILIPDNIRTRTIKRPTPRTRRTKKTQTTTDPATPAVRTPPKRIRKQPANTPE